MKAEVEISALIIGFIFVVGVLVGVIAMSAQVHEAPKELNNETVCDIVIRMEVIKLDRRVEALEKAAK